MSLGDLNRTNLVRAVECSSNYKPIIFCSISLTSIGMLLVVAGAIVMLIDHIELGPPQFDHEYERYVGSSLAHIVGPMFIAFGSLVVLGSMTVLAYATKTYLQRANKVDLTPTRRQELYETEFKSSRGNNWS